MIESFHVEGPKTETGTNGEMKSGTGDYLDGENSRA